MGKSKSVLEFAIPLKKRFVPSKKLGPGDVCNLQYVIGFFISKKMWRNKGSKIFE